MRVRDLGADRIVLTGLEAHVCVVVTSTETVVFQWLGRADSDAFREIAELLR